MDNDFGEHAYDEERRRSALRALAQARPLTSGSGESQPGSTSPFATRLDAPPRSPWRRIGSTLSVLAVIVVIGVVVANILGVLRLNTRPMPATVLRLNPIGDGLSCVTEIAWSPNGKLVAAMGNTVRCGGSAQNSQTGTVYLYDAHSGKLTAQLHPDAAVFKAYAVQQYIAANPTAARGVTSLLYAGMTWMPDSRALVFQFSLESSPSAGSESIVMIVNGILSLSIKDSAASSVWLNAIQPNPNLPFVNWDLTTGGTSQSPMPAAATAYRWGADGQLIPDNSSSAGPVGAPNSGDRFTIWQSGVLEYAERAPDPQTSSTADVQDVMWNTNLSPISPDGRYFYGYFPAYGSLTPPSTQHVFARERRIAPRDKALLALAQQMTQDAHPTTFTHMFVTWRPDGRYLAALPANAKAPALASAFTVSIYDTTTGKLIKQLTPSLAGLQPGAAGVETLAWSPDGAHLLLSDNFYGSITIWGPDQLPK
ncbi:MAG TPA: hypothetical protein VF812_16415 [Ktedonobacterales bacterium]